MQYIERIFSSAKRMYSDINSATLCGAIDVIVVKYPNGELVSSPFYVQFGKTGVLRPCADEVEVMINGVPRPDIRMRVNRYGQAYFDDPNSGDTEMRACSPNLDSGIQLDFQPGQSPPTSDTCSSPAPLETTAKTLGTSSPDIDSKQDILQSVPILLQSSDFSEFESNMQWWNQNNSTSDSDTIQTYSLTDEQSKAASQSANDSVWVYWKKTWYSWRTANIKLRFLRNLGSSLPPDFETIESKMMQTDRENPAFVLLPEVPSSLANEKEQEGTQFELDQSENSEVSVKPFPTDLHKASNDDVDEMSQNLRATFM
ncbi:hypothetical protein ACTXT7_004299 [Hymenolepis weldensis]